MKVRSYPGRAVLEDPELMLDPDATRGRAMELLYEASWRECGVNWTSNGTGSSKISRRQDDASYKRFYTDVGSQIELEDTNGPSTQENVRSRGSSSADTTESDSSEVNQPAPSSNTQGGFLIPRPRLIVPVHTYARKRRTGAPQPIKRRQIHEAYMFVGNYVGQEVTDHGVNFFRATCNGLWYTAPVRTQKLILFLMQKGIKNITLRIGNLYDASLEGFTALVNMAVSYFMLMYQTQ
nr:PREDICTED: uncharacterized protein LOC105672348 [Linepithema humile]